MAKSTKKLTITVAQPTADILHKVSKECGASLGEVVDRLALVVAPYDPEIAISMILEQYLICVSRLNKEDCAKVFGSVCGTFLGCIPPEELDDMVLRAKSMRDSMGAASGSMTEEELAKMRKTANEMFLKEGNEDVWKVMSAFIRGA